MREHAVEHALDVLQRCFAPDQCRLQLLSASCWLRSALTDMQSYIFVAR
jgi:hypothetical protein